jgi:curved DNA-binding protein CbpA
VSQPSFGELSGQDPYEILELPSGASEAEVRAARKRLLRKYHPDLPSGDLRRTQMITAAADLLLDPLRRIGYYGLRDEESRRTVFATAEPADIWSSRAGPARTDEPAPPKAEPREAPPSSGTRTDGHWFRPLGGFDGRAPRPQPSPEWNAFRPADSAAANGTPGSGTVGNGTVGNGTVGNSTVGNGTGVDDATGNGAATGGASAHTTPPTGSSGTSPPTAARPAAPDGFDSFGDSNGFGGFRRRGPRRRPTMSGGRWVTRTGHREAGTGEPESPPDAGGTAAGSTRPTASTTAPTNPAANGRGPGIRPTFITPPSQTEKSRPDPAGPVPRHAAGAEQPAAASRWNALAIASVVAILTWTPLPLILGIFALGQIRRYGQRGTRLALIGVIAGGILLVVYFYILVISR